MGYYTAYRAARFRSRLVKGIRNMKADVHQIELTDQELEQVTGGSNPVYGLGFVGSGFTIGSGSTGISGNGQALGFGAGNDGAFGFANDQSFGNQFKGPAGLGDNFAYNGGTAYGFGW